MSGRRLTPDEGVLARQVFGLAIDLDRVRIGRWPGRFAFALGSRVFFPREVPEDFAAEPPWRQAWLVHELTHVWQFQTRPGRTLASWAKVVLTGGYGPRCRGYAYGLPLRPFDRYNLEQQARLVEHAFLAGQGAVSPTMPIGACPEHYSACVPFAAAHVGVSTRP